MIKIYTDGACIGNPGPGGWGVVIINDENMQTLSGHEADTTNNRMELMAAIEALKAVAGKSPVTLVTDSQYVRRGITEWISGWKRNGWRTASKGAVKNQDLWQELDRLNSNQSIDWQWVKGHSGHPMNEKVDQLASCC